MILYVNNNGKEMELDGIIRGVNNKFYVEIRVPKNVKLEHIIKSIKGEYNFKGKVTLINNMRSAVIVNKGDLNESIYVYEAGCLISDYVEEDDILISSMLVYFKELDYFFVEDEYKIDTEKMKTELTITQKYNSEILLDNENLTLIYNRMPGIDHDSAGHTLFLTQAKINMIFKNRDCSRQKSRFFFTRNKIVIM